MDASYSDSIRYPTFVVLRDLLAELALPFGHEMLRRNYGIATSRQIIDSKSGLVYGYDLIVAITDP